MDQGWMRRRKTPLLRPWGSWVQSRWMEEVGVGREVGGRKRERGMEGLRRMVSASCQLLIRNTYYYPSKARKERNKESN